MSESVKHITELGFDIQKALADLEMLNERTEVYASKIKKTWDASVAGESNGKGSSSTSVEVKTAKEMNTLYEKSTKLVADMRNFRIQDASLSERINSNLSETERLWKRISVENKEITQEERERLKIINAETDLLEAQVKSARNLNKNIAPVPKENYAQQILDKFRWTSAFMLTQAAEQGVRETIATLKEVEFSVMEITRVLDDSNLDVEAFTGKIFQSAIDYANTFENASEITKRFAQAGYNADDSLQMLKTTMLALNTAELSTEQATTSLISIMQQWGLEAEDYELLVDKINITSDDYALTSQDLVDALMKSSSVAKNAGMNFDDLVSTLTALKVSSGQAGTAVGNAFRSIISYIQRPMSLTGFEDMGIAVFADDTKTKLLPMMEILENMANKWNAMSKSAQENFMDKNAELTKMLDVSGEYADSLETQNRLKAEGASIEEIEQSNLAAGNLRRNYYISLMENWQQVADVNNNLLDAEGYSMQENSKYMDTLAAKYNQFITTLKELATEAGNNGMTDLAKNLLTIATAVAKASKGFAALPSVVSLAVVALSLLNKEFKIVKGFDGTNLKSFSLNLKEIGTQAIAAKVKLMGARLEVIALNAALSFGITVLVQFAIEGLAYLINYSDKVNEKFQETTQNISNITQSIRDTSKGADEVKTRYAELAGGVNSLGENVSLTAKEFEEFQTLQNTLAELFPQLIQGTDGQGNAILNLGGNMESIISTIDDLVAKQKELAQTELLKSADEAFEVYGKKVKSSEDRVSALNNELKNMKVENKEFFLTQSTDIGAFENRLKALGVSYEKVFSDDRKKIKFEVDTDGIENLDEVTKKKRMEIEQEIALIENEITQAYSNLKPIVKAKLEIETDFGELNKESQGFVEAILSTMQFDTAGETEKFASDIVNSLLSNKDNVQGAVSEMFDLKDAYQQGEYETEDYIESLKYIFGELEDALPDSMGEALNNLYDKFLSVSEVSDETAGGISYFGKAIEASMENIGTLGESLTTFQSSMSSLTDIVQSYNDSGYYTIDNLLKLLSLAPEYIGLLDMENGQLVINEQNTRILENAKKDEVIALIKEQAAIRLAELAQRTLDEATKDVNSSTGIAKGTLSDFATQALNLGTSAAGAATGVSFLSNKLKELAGAKAGKLDMSEFEKEAKKIVSQTNDIVSQIDKVSMKSIAGGYKSSGARTPSSKSPSTKSASTKKEKTWFEQQSEYFTHLVNLGQKTEKQILDFYKSMAKSGKLSLEELQKVHEKIYTSNKAYVDDYISDFEKLEKYGKKTQDELIKFYRDTLKNTWKTSDQIESLQEKLFNAEKKKLEDILDKQLDSIKKQKEKIEELYDAQTEKIEAEKDAIEEKSDKEIESIKKVEAENDRIRAKDEFLKNIADAENDLAFYGARSGIDARRSEIEAKKKIDELREQRKQQLAEYNQEDEIARIEEKSKKEIEALDEKLEKLKVAYDDSMKDAEKRTDLLNEKMSDANIANLAYAATFSGKAYDVYLEQFIYPVSNGLVDGFTQASDIILGDFSTVSDNLLKSFMDKFIEPANKEMLNALKLASQIGSGSFGLGALSPSAIAGAVTNISRSSTKNNTQSTTINNQNYNTFSDKVDLQMFEKKLGNIFNDAFFNLPRLK